MRIEDLQDKLHGSGTLAGGYAVVWNGTTASASGTRYLDADDYVPRVAVKAGNVLDRPLTAVLRDWLESYGPATLRELSTGMDVDLFKLNSAMASLRTRGAVEIVGRRTIVVEKFGPRSVAVWGLAS